MNRWLLYTLSFFTNAAILVFEIAGGRLVAPYLGTSVGVWAGLIAVVLGGMAIGYHFGGKIADRNASLRMIGGFLLAASITALLSWNMRDWVSTIATTGALSETVGALIAGAILFLPTVVILAAVSPMIAKNLITKLSDSAGIVGTITAVGTTGSIIGAIGTGMVLIPNFGIDAILLGVAVLLFLLAVLTLGKSMLKNMKISRV